MRSLVSSKLKHVKKRTMKSLETTIKCYTWEREINPFAILSQSNLSALVSAPHFVESIYVNSMAGASQDGN